MSAAFGFGLTCEEVEDSLSAYALGALDADEVTAVDEHLAQCEACRQQLAMELATVGALGFAASPVEPSNAARERLMSAVRRPAEPVREPVPIGAARTSRTRWMLAALSAAAVLLLIGVGVLGAMLQEARDQREESQSVAQLLSTYISSGGQVVTLQAMPAPIYEQYKGPYEGQGSLLLAPGMEPVVVVAECPKSGEHLTYWVWFARNGERTPVGKLSVGDDGSGWLTVQPDLAVEQFDTIGITIVMEDEERQDVLVAPLASNTVEG